MSELPPPKTVKDIALRRADFFNSPVTVMRSEDVDWLLERARQADLLAAAEQERDEALAEVKRLREELQGALDETDGDPGTSVPRECWWPHFEAVLETPTPDKEPQ